ncbi:hypothetical protein ACTVNX_03810 [Serratia nevei]|uniref:hypothetical protein n=1 Tax=Serratia nevei TaxID=2703794 RepID=UPI003FA781DA|nr:hypothetical protein [Serratia marcescens]
MNTNTQKHVGIVYTPGPAYRHISEFIVENPYYDLPVSQGIIGAYFLSNKMKNPLNNHANLSKPLLRIGSPTVGNSFTSFSDGNQYDTQLPVGTSAASNAAVTIITVAKNPSKTADAWPIGNYLGGSGAISSDNILLRKDAQMEVYTSNGTGLASTVTNLVGAGATGQLLITAGQFGPTSVTGSCYRPAEDDLLQSSRAVESRKTKPTANYRIGGRPGMTGNGTPDVACVLIYEGRMSNADLLTVCRYLRMTFGARYNLWSE